MAITSVIAPSLVTSVLETEGSGSTPGAEPDPFGPAVRVVERARDWLAHSAPQALRWGSRLAVVIGAAALVILLCTALVRHGATRRVLRTRVSYAVLPSDTFDPSPEEILRYSHQLTRTRRAVLGGLDRAGSAIRIRLDSVSGGRVLYRIEGPARATSILRLPGYAEVDLVDALSPDGLAGRVVTWPAGADAATEPPPLEDRPNPETSWEEAP